MQEKMTTTKLIGLIVALIGIVFSFVHLGLMIFTDLSRRYHYFVELMLIGFVLTLAGVILLGNGQNPNNRS